MSNGQQHAMRQCVSCGINIAGSNAARFDCPECESLIFRCPTCRKQSNLYECHDCGFTGP
jgi:predicted RNA-binding Zn-ribbon protein involved in translation (DUF1610 family)